MKREETCKRLRLEQLKASIIDEIRQNEGEDGISFDDCFDVLMEIAAVIEPEFDLN